MNNLQLHISDVFVDSWVDSHKLNEANAYFDKGLLVISIENKSKLEYFLLSKRMFSDKWTDSNLFESYYLDISAFTNLLHYFLSLICILFLF